MRHIAALVVLALASITSVAEVSPEVKAVQHKATLEIVMLNSAKHEGAGCSAIAISEHVLLTAQHCDVDDAVIYFNQNKRPFTNGRVVTEKYFDDNDHMLLVVPSVSFKYTISYDASKVRKMKQGEHLYLWGNPALLMDQYREVYATGKVTLPSGDEVNAAGEFEMISGPVVGGDSGSAIFSAEDGQLVGITTWGMFGGMFLGSYPLQFTQEQVDQAEGKGTFVYLPDTRPQITVIQSAPVIQLPPGDLFVIEFALSGVFWILALALIGFVAFHVRKPVLIVVKYVGRVVKVVGSAFFSVGKSLVTKMRKI